MPPRDGDGWASALVFTLVVVMLTVGALLIPLAAVTVIVLLLVR